MGHELSVWNGLKKALHEDRGKNIVAIIAAIIYIKSQKADKNNYQLGKFLFQETNVISQYMRCIFQRCVCYQEVIFHRNEYARPYFRYWLVSAILSPIFSCTYVRISYGDLPFQTKVSAARRYPLFSISII